MQDEKLKPEIERENAEARAKSENSNNGDYREVEKIENNRIKNNTVENKIQRDF
jgi:hypothetical protein